MFNFLTAVSSPGKLIDQQIPIFNLKPTEETHTDSWFNSSYIDLVVFDKREF
jgi:hypothetical protein